MANNILQFTIYELFLSTFFGLISIYLSQVLICKTILRCQFGDLFQKENMALSIFGGTLIVCFLILTRASILPSVTFLQYKASGPAGLDFAFYIQAFLYFLLFFAVSFLSAMVLLFMSSKIVTISTKDIDEVIEIKKGNISTALLISFVMLSFTLYTKPSLEHFLSGVVHALTAP